MQRVSYQSVIDQAAALAGFTSSTLTASPKSLLRQFINRRLRGAWEHWWWPQLMRAELRYYRDAYDAGTTYASGDEVYYSTTGLYYAATGATTANAPTDTNYWSQVTDLDAYISLDQTGQTEIGTVRGVYKDDPETTDRPRRVLFRMAPSGIQVLGESVPVSVYVWFRDRVPVLLGTDYSATATYTVGQVAYYSSSTYDYEGDWWECVSATNAGENPETAAAKWSRREFPAWLRDCVAQRAYADWLRQDGQPEAAVIEDGIGKQLLFEAINQAGPAQRQHSYAAGA